MSLFEQYQTNTEKEVNGVPVTFGTNSDKTEIKFYLARTGKSNKEYTKMLERETRPFRRQIDLGTMNAEQADGIYQKVFVQTVLKGWENVRDKKGVDIPFSHENANKLFEQLPDLYEDLQNAAKSASNFRDESIEGDAKN